MDVTVQNLEIITDIFKATATILKALLIILLKHLRIVAIVFKALARAADFLSRWLQFWMTKWSKKPERLLLHPITSYWESRVQILKTTGNISAITGMFLGLIGILENPIHKITIVSVLFLSMITHGLTNSVQIRMFLFVKWHLMVILFTLLAPFLLPNFYIQVLFLSTHFCKRYCKVAYLLTLSCFV